MLKTFVVKVFCALGCLSRVQSRVRPAFQKLRAWHRCLRRQKRPSGENVGFPNGACFYALFVYCLFLCFLLCLLCFTICCSTQIATHTQEGPSRYAECAGSGARVRVRAGEAQRLGPVLLLATGSSIWVFLWNLLEASPRLDPC